MSQDIVRVGDGPLQDHEVADQVRRLQSAREYVRTCLDEDEVLSAARQAEMVRQWVRISKGAAEVALEACKLQATALRRLCQLGSGDVGKQDRIAGNWLASLDDPAFDELLDGMGYAKTPVTLYKEHLRRLERQQALQRGRDIASGEGAPADYESVCRAANDLLHAALSGEATTVNELSDELASALDLSLDCEKDYVLREGIEAVVREALRSEAFGTGDGHPAFITWKDADAGWLRIPWPAGTVSQLRWMAEFRQEQARELKAAADDLSALAGAMERTARDCGLTRLNDIWRVFARTQAKDAA